MIPITELRKLGDDVAADVGAVPIKFWRSPCMCQEQC